MLSCKNRKVFPAPLLEPAEIQATQISRHLRYCLLPSHAYQGRGLPEGEQKLFYRLLLGNLLLLRKVVKRLALQQSLWLNHPAFGTMDLIAQHITLWHLFPHICHTRASVTLKVSSDTSYSSPILAIARTYFSLLWRSWTAFHFPLPGKVDRVHTDKGFQQAVFVNSWVELHLLAVHN